MINIRGQMGQSARLKMEVLEVLYNLASPSMITDSSDLREQIIAAGERVNKVTEKLGLHTTNDREVLLRNANKIVDIAFDSKAIHICVSLDQIYNLETRVNEEREERRIVLEYIRHGACARCMASIFGISRRKVRELRRQVGKNSAPKSVKLGSRQRDDILYIWNLRDENKTSETDTILMISCVTGISINLIFSAIHDNVTPHNNSNITSIS